jgi:hypothetical protein
MILGHNHCHEKVGFKIQTGKWSHMIWVKISVRKKWALKLIPGNEPTWFWVTTSVRKRWALWLILDNKPIWTPVHNPLHEEVGIQMHTWKWTHMILGPRLLTTPFMKRWALKFIPENGPTWSWDRACSQPLSCQQENCSWSVC